MSCLMRTPTIQFERHLEEGCFGTVQFHNSDTRQSRVESQAQCEYQVNPKIRFAKICHQSSCSCLYTCAILAPGIHAWYLLANDVTSPHVPTLPLRVILSVLQRVFPERGCGCATHDDMKVALFIYGMEILLFRMERC